MNEEAIKDKFEEFVRPLTQEQLTALGKILDSLRGIDSIAIKCVLEYALGYVQGWLDKEEQRVADAENWSYHPDHRPDEHGDDVRVIDFVSKLPLSVLEQIPPLLKEIKDFTEFSFDLGMYSRRRLESITKVNEL